jgi:hypothetical protein
MSAQVTFSSIFYCPVTGSTLLTTGLFSLHELMNQFLKGRVHLLLPQLFRFLLYSNYSICNYNKTKKTERKPVMEITSIISDFPYKKHAG